VEKEITWITLTDGRKDLIKQTIPCWEKNLSGNFSNKIIIDDSGDSDYRSWLKKTFKGFEIVPVDKDRAGYVNAMKKVFSVAKEANSPYVFHLEDDFLIKKEFDLNNFVSVLDQNARLVQMAFLRDPWYENEIRDGGTLRTLVKGGKRISRAKNKDFQWMEHRIFWTCNPSVYPLRITENEWPDRKHSEFYFGRSLFKDKNNRSGMWGGWSDKPLVTHTGSYQKGINY
jgi:hypothetical protein